MLENWFYFGFEVLSGTRVKEVLWLRRAQEIDRQCKKEKERARERSAQVCVCQGKKKGQEAQGEREGKVETQRVCV